MKIAILLKNGPCTDEADRALQTAADMLTQGHSVNLFLLQEAVGFCQSCGASSEPLGLQKLIEKDLAIHVLKRDAELRGILAPAAGSDLIEGSYESLIGLMETCDRVIGIL